MWSQVWKCILMKLLSCHLLTCSTRWKSIRLFLLTLKARWFIVMLWERRRGTRRPKVGVKTAQEKKGRWWANEAANSLEANCLIKWDCQRSAERDPLWKNMPRVNYWWRRKRGKVKIAFQVSNYRSLFFILGWRGGTARLPDNTAATSHYEKDRNEVVTRERS